MTDSVGGLASHGAGVVGGVGEPDSPVDPATDRSGDGPRPARSRRPADWIARAVVQVPDRVVLLALSAMLATAVTVQLEIFHPYTVVPLFVLLAALTWQLAPRAVPADRWHLIGVGVAVLVVLLWFVAHRPYVSELLSVRRDPSIYTLRGIWLMNHPSPDVTLTQQLLDIRRAVPQAGLDYGGETFRLTRHFQSTSVVPGLIAIAGWVGGVHLLLQADLVIGMGALMAVYAIGRRMGGPVFGLVPMVAMAAAVPLAAFSRVAYTEPLSMIGGMAALLGLWCGVQERRPAMWLLAGIGAGSVVVARIDGWLVPIGAVVGFGVWGAFAVTREGRRRVLVALGWFGLSAVLVGTLGLLDLIVHSPGYLRALAGSTKPLVAAVPAVVLVAVLVTVLPGIPVVARWCARHSRGLAIVVVAGFGVVMLVMLLRPLFFVSRMNPGGAYAQGVINRQIAEHLPVDGSRSYDELSLTWIAWYLGWPTLILACLSGLLAVWVAVRRRSAALVLVVSVAAVNAALYLNAVSITPDQVWAMRRLLPVIMPGGLLLIGWALFYVWQSRGALAGWWSHRFGDRDRLPGSPARPRVPRTVGSVLAVLAVVVSLTPLLAWRGVYSVAEGAGQLQFVQNICSRIQGQKVLLLGKYPKMGFYQPTFRNLCDAEVITLASPTPEQITAVTQRWGPGPFTVVTFNPDSIPWSAPPGPADYRVDYQMWDSTLSHRPDRGLPEATEVWFGTARPDGKVDPQ